MIEPKEFTEPLTWFTIFSLCTSVSGFMEAGLRASSASFAYLGSLGWKLVELTSRASEAVHSMLGLRVPVAIADLWIHMYILSL